MTPALMKLLPYKEDIIKMRENSMSLKKIEKALNKGVKGNPFKGATIQSFLKKLEIE